MENNEYNVSQAVDYKDAAYIWVGKTSTPDQYIGLFRVSLDTNHVENVKFLLKVNKDVSELTIANEFDKAEITDEIKRALSLMFDFPKVDGKYAKASLDTVTVTGDLNLEMLSKGYLPLKETTVFDKLTFLGDDLSSYTYESLKASTKLSIDPIDMSCQEALDSYALIPDKFKLDLSQYKDYVLPMRFNNELNLLFKARSYSALLFIGPSGTGKSTCAPILCSRLGLPFNREQWTGETTSFDVVSEVQPELPSVEDLLELEVSGDDMDVHVKSELNNGISYTIKLGGIIPFIKYGGVYQIDEFNRAHAQAFMHALLDDSGVVKLADGTVLHKSPYFKLVLTANPICQAGTFNQSPALLNRCKSVYVPALVKEELIARIVNGKLKFTQNPMFLNKLVESITTLLDSYRANSWDKDITQRNIEGFIEDLHNGGEFEETFYNHFLDVLSLEDVPTPQDYADAKKVAKPVCDSLKASWEQTTRGEVTEGSVSVDILDEISSFV